MKYSIHIGINQYDPIVYGDSNLKKCVRDAQAMYDLAQNIGFEPLMIHDADATRSSYLDLMREMADKLTAGDVLLVTQSSHGTYWDMGKKRATGMCMHDDVLWDFEHINIWKWFKPGVKIIRMIDCCFSESNFRLMPGKMPEGTPKVITVSRGPVVKPTTGTLRSCKATILSFASCNIEEVSYENQDGGVFTLAVESVFKSGTPTYKQLLKGVASTMHKWGYPQTPKLETAKAGNYQNTLFAS